MAAIFVRSLILYLIVFIAIRLMGKREVGQLQPFELVITIMIADLASFPVQEIGIPLVNGVIPIFALLVGQIVISFINIKNKTMRRIITGEPTVLIQKGKIIENKLTKQKYAMEALIEQLRVSGYATIDSVDYAILETSGQISVIPKPEQMNVKIQDMNLQGTYRGMERPLIIDGEYIDENIKEMGYDREWVNKKLKENNLKIKNTFILVSDENGTVFCQRKAG